MKLLNASLASLILSASCIVNIAQAGLLTYDFNAVDGTNSGFSDGAVLTSNSAADAQVVGNRLRLTNGTNNNKSAFHLTSLAGSANGFNVSFDFEIIAPATGNPADGFAFSYGNLPFGSLSNKAEEGWSGSTPVISWEIDTYGDVGAGIAVDGTDIAGGFNYGKILNGGQTIFGQINIKLDAAGLTGFTSTGAITNANFNGLASGFTLDNNYSFAIAARTGGSTQTLFIDNLKVETINVPEPSTLAIFALSILGLVSRRFKK
tara:strand:- start:4259 stop:5044 length:786 start_codon:yes stop_codon:yes gene_type:complete